MFICISRRDHPFQFAVWPPLVSWAAVKGALRSQASLPAALDASSGQTGNEKNQRPWHRHLRVEYADGSFKGGYGQSGTSDSENSSSTSSTSSTGGRAFNDRAGASNDCVDGYAAWGEDRLLREVAWRRCLAGGLLLHDAFAPPLDAPPNAPPYAPEEALPPGADSSDADSSDADLSDAAAHGAAAAAPAREASEAHPPPPSALLLWRGVLRERGHRRSKDEDDVDGSSSICGRDSGARGGSDKGLLSARAITAAAVNVAGLLLRTRQFGDWVEVAPFPERRAGSDFVGLWRPPPQPVPPLSSCSSQPSSSSSSSPPPPPLPPSSSPCLQSSLSATSGSRSSRAETLGCSGGWPRRTIDAVSSPLSPGWTAVVPPQPATYLPHPEPPTAAPAHRDRNRSRIAQEAEPGWPLLRHSASGSPCSSSSFAHRSSEFTGGVVGGRGGVRGGVGSGSGVVRIAWPRSGAALAMSADRTVKVAVDLVPDYNAWPPRPIASAARAVSSSLSYDWALCAAARPAVFGMARGFDGEHRLKHGHAGVHGGGSADSGITERGGWLPGRWTCLPISDANGTRLELSLPLASCHEHTLSVALVELAAVPSSSSSAWDAADAMAGSDVGGAAAEVLGSAEAVVGFRDGSACCGA